MPRAPRTKKLERLALRLIERDLKRIAAFKIVIEEKGKPRREEEPPPGAFAIPLTRYFSALMNHKRLTERLDDDERERLKKLTTKELERLAGLQEGSTAPGGRDVALQNEKVSSAQGKVVPKARPKRVR